MEQWNEKPPVHNVKDASLLIMSKYYCGAISFFYLFAQMFNATYRYSLTIPIFCGFSVLIYARKSLEKKEPTNIPIVILGFVGIVSLLYDIYHYYTTEHIAESYYPLNFNIIFILAFSIIIFHSIERKNA